MSILYFEFVLLGGWLAQRPPSAVRHPAVDALIAVGLFAVYIFAKYLMVVVGRHACWYGLIYVLVFTITFYMFRVSWSHMADVILRRCGVVSLLISCLATMTLEIYVVQNVILDVPALQNATFPLNICLFGLVVLVLSTLVFLISTQVRQRVERYIGGSSGPRQSGVQKEPVANHAST